ncbi:hypothetical protein GCM10011378_40240 [Hymenobacter glacieicola]|uniref:Uncharacterized protein n=1 Tax=Hymenobacter glacieicola TaxID=1562124 RepID=A0ABQ1X4Y0_9BACT|nr:hypothetical protein GCM10011378_40240 [Hymenobacter glacieicola]
MDVAPDEEIHSLCRQWAKASPKLNVLEQVTTDPLRHGVGGLHRVGLRGEYKPTAARFPDQRESDNVLRRAAQGADEHEQH